MLSRLHALFGGSSPITGYLGSLIIVLDVAQQALLQGGIPSSAIGWVTFVSTFLTGLAVRFSKDENKTNAPQPTPVPVTVK